MTPERTPEEIVVDLLDEFENVIRSSLRGESLLEGASLKDTPEILELASGLDRLRIECREAISELVRGEG